MLADAVPQAVAPCCYTLDPASRLLTSHFNEEMLVLPPEWLIHEYAEDDVIQAHRCGALAERGLDVVRGHRRRSQLKPSLACPHGRRR